MEIDDFIKQNCDSYVEVEDALILLADDELVKDDKIET